MGEQRIGRTRGLHPDGVHEKRGDEDARDEMRINGAELRAIDAALDHGSDDRPGAGDDFLAVEGVEVREFLQFRHDDAEHRVGCLEANAGPVLGEELVEERGGGGVGIVALEALGVFDARDDFTAHDGLEEFFLGGEVEVDGALADAGALRDVVESGGGEPLLAKDLESGAQDLLGALFRCTPSPDDALLGSRGRDHGESQ